MQVRTRPIKNINPKMITGEIEIEGNDVTVLNKSSILPMAVNSSAEFDSKTEEVRLKHRHLDLRRPIMQRNLAVRSHVSLTGRHLKKDI